MKKPIHIRAAVREVRWPAIAPVLISLLLPLSFPWVGTTFAFWSGGIAFLVAIAWGSYCSGHPTKILRNRGAIVTDEGIGPTLDDEPLWILPWSRFGGYRLVSVSEWRRIWHPQEEGTELLDVQGIVVGLINASPDSPIYGTSGDSYKVIARQTRQKEFWQEVDSHVRDGGAKYIPPPVETPAYAKATPRRVKRQLMVSAIATSLAATWISALQNAATSDEPAAWHGIAMSPLVGIAGTTLFVIGLFQGASGSLGYMYLKRPKSGGEIEPLEGPKFNEFLATHDGLPQTTVLQDRKRYVQVDPEHRRPRLKGGKSTGIAGAVIFSLFFFPSISVGWLFFLIMSIGYIPMIWVCILAWRYSVDALGSLDDTILSIDGGMVVVKRDGSHIAFSSRAKRHQPSALTRKILGPFEIWQEGEKHYFLDRAHLIEASVQLDHEELMDLERVAELT